MNKLLGSVIDPWQFISKAQFKYEKTTDWQMVYVDFSEVPHPYFIGNWIVTMMTPFRPDGKGVTTDDGIYIDWMGWFASAADAHEYAGLSYEAPVKPEMAPEEKRAMESSLRIHNRTGDLKPVVFDGINDSYYGVGNITRTSKGELLAAGIINVPRTKPLTAGVERLVYAKNEHSTPSVERSF